MTLLRTGASIRPLPRVMAGGEARWFLVMPATLEAGARPKPAAATPAAPLLMLASCAYLSFALLNAYVTRPSEAFGYWGDCALALMLCEYFAAFAAGFTAHFRKTDLDGKPDYFLLVMIGALLVFMALPVALTFLREWSPIVAYFALLAGRIGTAFRLPAQGIGESVKRSAIAIAVNLAALSLALFIVGTRESQVLAAALYFGFVGLFEARASWRASSR